MGDGVGEVHVGAKAPSTISTLLMARTHKVFMSAPLSCTGEVVKYRGGGDAHIGDLHFRAILEPCVIFHMFIQFNF